MLYSCQKWEHKCRSPQKMKEKITFLQSTISITLERLSYKDTSWKDKLFVKYIFGIDDQIFMKFKGAHSGLR